MIRPTNIIIFVFLGLIAACGKSKSVDSLSPPAFELEAEGIYSATLKPVNPSFSPKVQGLVTVSKYGDDFNVRVSLKNASKGVHIQGIYTGATCPLEDLNSDGVIDIKEAQKDAGKMRLPFDGDLSGLIVGSDFYPVDNYSYDRSASYQLMISDLKNKKLKLKHSVVLILGVAPDQVLPETVAPLKDKTPQESVPIACGLLKFVPDDINTHEPEPPHVRPRPPHHNEPPTVEPIPPEYQDGGFWGRLRRWWHRLGNWFRGDQSDHQGTL